MHSDTVVFQSTLQASNQTSHPKPNHPPPPLHLYSPGKFELKFRYLIFQIISVIDGWGIPCNFALITCQNFEEIWQVCSSDGLCVCLSVCNVNDTGRTVQAINTKLGTCMYLGSGYGCIVFGVHDVIDDVIRSKNRSNFEIAITPSIFELECRTKSQKIGNGMTYLGVGLNFRYNFRFKSSPGPQNGGHFEIFEIF